MAKQISYARFLKLLSKSPRDWRLRRDGSIRFGKSKPGYLPECPWLWIRRQVGKPLNLAVKCVDIFVAADHPGWLIFRKHQRIRRDLLKACGLEEKRA